MRSRRRRRSGRRIVAVVGSVALVATLGVIVWTQVGAKIPPIAQRCIASGDGVAAALDTEQSLHAATIAMMAVERDLPPRAVTIALATAMQESKIRNIDYGDRDSLGLFQQRPSQGWGTEEQVQDPHYATDAFYDALVQVNGYQDMEITVAAQAVQRSGFPDAYAQHEKMARLFAAGSTGQRESAVVCRLRGTSGAGRADMPAAVQERLTLDLPSLTAELTSDDVPTITIDTAPLPGQSVQRSWAVASWAVLTAAHTGVSEVTVAGMHWVRSDGADAAWQPLPEDHPGAEDAAGVVRLS